MQRYLHNLRLTVLIQHLSVTDTQTDKTHDDDIYHASVASRGKMGHIAHPICTVQFAVTRSYFMHFLSPLETANALVLRGRYAGEQYVHCTHYEYIGIKGRHVSRSKMFIPVGDLNPHLVQSSLDLRESAAGQHLDRLSKPFLHNTNTQTTYATCDV